MRKYRCHKVVEAFKITEITQAPVSASSLPRHMGGDWLLHGEGEQANVGHRDYYLKFTPAPGGYFVQYEDGYQSYSPTGAFEGGYTLIPESTMAPHQQRVLDEKNELDAKLGKLTTFLTTPTFKGLPVEERDRLVYQRSAMAMYAGILGERIVAFTR